MLFILQETSNQYLNWFKDIKESHGSVEVTSLKQVDAIKDRGIFKVGYPGDAVKRKHQLVKYEILICLIHLVETSFRISHILNTVRPLICFS